MLASIYLQAVIAASMEEVELFLAPLTARSKVREVLRGLVATRQVHTISMGHAPHFYVAGTLPEFAASPIDLCGAPRFLPRTFHTGMTMRRITGKSRTRIRLPIQRLHCSSTQGA